MSSFSTETIHQLPQLERNQLLAELPRTEQNEWPKEKYKIPEGRVIRTDAVFDDRALEYKWLAEHRREYVGEWIALKGCQLIAHGLVGKEVFSKARESGVRDAMVLFIEDPDVAFANF
jgi:Family of unknown function (DUF5678)